MPTRTKIEVCILFLMSRCKGRTKRPCDLLKFIANRSLALFISLGTTLLSHWYCCLLKPRENYIRIIIIYLFTGDTSGWWKNLHRNQVQGNSLHIETSIAKLRVFSASLVSVIILKIRVFAEKVLPKMDKLTCKKLYQIRTRRFYNLKCVVNFLLVLKVTRYTENFRWF